MDMTVLDVRRTNTILYCRRWRETIRFYRDGLKFPISYATDWLVEFRLTDDSYISLADETRATIPSARGAGMTLSWQVDDADEMHRCVAALGMAPGPIQKKWNASVFYFRDPEGHRIELWSPLYRKEADPAPVCRSRRADGRGSAV